MKRRIKTYMAVFEKEKVDGYSVWVPELPGCASQGETLEEAIANIREAIDLYLEDSSQEEADVSTDRLVIAI